jgi:RimJ/RimL family protein N-acetyltransferase
MDASAGCMAELTGGSYYAVRDGYGGLAGFYCIGASARVPAGQKLHAYDDTGLMDIGLGMAPTLCGKGLGLAFLVRGLAFLREEFSASAFRLSVAAFNRRAIRVYEKAGFIKTGSFLRKDEKGKWLWPGYGDNFRVLNWIIDRCENKVDAEDTAIGYVPKAGDINLEGLDYTIEGDKKFDIATLGEILTVEKEFWKEDVENIKEFYAKFGDKLPKELSGELTKLENNLK